jgi:PAS domain S-box-containing protein
MLSVPSADSPLADIPPELAPLLDWFNANVQKLEGAYSELGRQFAAVSRELEISNKLLEHNQRRLGALLKCMNTGVIMVDPEGRLVELNDAAEKLLDVQRAHCLGNSLGEVFDAETGVGRALRLALDTGSDEVQLERSLQLTRGAVPVAITGSRVIDADGNLIGAMETFTDLTDLKRMQAEVQQDRVLRALGEMAATVAHEIRNPLGGIGGYAGLLARGIPPEDPKRKLVDKIIGGVSSLNKIVSNLLVYTRRTILQKQPVDMSVWLEGILAHAEIEIEKEGKDIRLERAFPAEPVRIEIDSERFQQILLNLLINSIQAIEGSGVIRVGLRMLDKRWELSIVDSGKGIAAENLEQIFTPFFTTKEQGTGLGLAIVKKIVDLHEGEISVESQVGVGTTFRIVLPGV